MSTENLIHISNLQGICRLCGSKKQLKYMQPFSKEIKEIFQIDINNDNCNVHPPKFCNSCRGKCFRYRSAKEKGEQYSCKICLPINFEEHQISNCKVCNKQKGRPSVNFKSFTFPGQSSKKNADQEHTTVKDVKEDEASSFANPEPCCSKPNNKGTCNIDLNFCANQLTSDTETDTASEKEEPDSPNKYIPAKKSRLIESTSSVSKVLDFDNQCFDSSISFSNLEITSISLDRAVEKNLAEIFQCSICKGLPVDPVITSCSHIYCRTCIMSWLNISSACPICRLPVDSEDIKSLTGQLSLMYDALHVTCRYNGCESFCTLKLINQHEDKCKYGKYPQSFLKNQSSSKRGEGLHKMPIYDCRSMYLKQKRLKPVIESVNQFCQKQHENMDDVLFFMLYNHLKDRNDPRYKMVHTVWREGADMILTVHECLALRIDTLQSKTQYKSQFDLFQKKHFNPFQPPYAVDSIEYQYVPPSARYSLEGEEYHENVYHTPAKPKSNIHIVHNANCSFEPINILADFPETVPELAIPNVKGVRWSYPDALAKTLEELEPAIIRGFEQNGINPLDNSILLKTFVKDGADGLGDVSVYKERGDRYLPDKAFRFSFCVFRIDAVFPENEKSITIFLEDKPNSVRTNRPLLQTICDENSKASSTLCLQVIENERTFMKNKIMRVQNESGWRRHSISFYNSMIDEKLDRSNSGLAGSGSAYLCTLCDATRETAKSKLGSFNINRTLQETNEIANYIRVNPDNLSKSDLDKICKGVKSHALLQAEAGEKGLDATHADINCGSFFKKLIIREIACVNSWDVTQDIKPIIQNAECMFDKCVKELIGSNPQLMMPGNYSRMLFDESNESHILSLIENYEKKTQISNLLTKFRCMRKIYRAVNPREQYPEETKSYKETAVSFGQSLLNDFSYAKWPNYIHKVIEHVQELIEAENGPGTVGGLSGEGNEGGNKIFRHFRKNLARKGDTYGALRDVLWVHWLYSSPKLVSLAMKSHSKKHCSFCFQEGHNIRSCPAAH